MKSIWHKNSKKESWTSTINNPLQTCLIFFLWKLLSLSTFSQLKWFSFLPWSVASFSSINRLLMNVSSSLHNFPSTKRTDYNKKLQVRFSVKIKTKFCIYEFFIPFNFFPRKIIYLLIVSDSDYVALNGSKKLIVS